MEIAGVDRERARAAIAEAGGRVRTAIVMLRRGVDREGAEALLRAHDNHLRPIIGDPPPVADR
jgi:N-acetylmuramic acid 6-phosphate etherase